MNLCKIWILDILKSKEFIGITYTFFEFQVLTYYILYLFNFTI